MIDSVRWITENRKIIESYNDSENLFPGKLRLIDQTKLPDKLEYIETDSLNEIFYSIKDLVVRGAPAIGCAAALGLAAVAQHFNTKNSKIFYTELEKAAEKLASSRPTAVNLFWALDRCKNVVKSNLESPPQILRTLLLREALNILSEDINMCKQIGNHGVSLIKNGYGILTHCNAGALATGDFGTALSPIYTAHRRGLKLTVYSDETRPLLQGSRLTAWELMQAGIDVVTICDNMAAMVMKEGKINIVIVGADRIAANGDTANKIGTYGVAVLAKYHNIPFYVAAPYSTFDLSVPNGQSIPIEERDSMEIKYGFGKLTAPKNVKTYNPAFDVTPYELITGFITEKGIFNNINSLREKIKQ